MWIAVASTCTGAALAFNKAGEKWWKALIPIYNIWVEAEIGQSPPSWFWIQFAAPIVGGFLLAVGSVLVSIGMFDFDSVMAPVGFFVMFLGFAVMVAGLGYYGRILYNFARCFGKGSGFAVGLLLLPPIFWLVLGLDNSLQYRPPSGPSQPPYGYSNMSGIQGPGPYEQQVVDSQASQQQMSAFPRQAAEPGAAENSTKLPAETVAGYTLMIIVPLAACCMIVEFLTSAM